MTTARFGQSDSVLQHGEPGMATMSDSIGELEYRKVEEMEFHNRREMDRQLLSEAEFMKRYANKKWYAVDGSSRLYMEQWLQQHCPGRVALDYCCGLGGVSLRMAQFGAYVHGIDISDESVRTSRELLAREGYSARCEMEVMDAEAMRFPDQMFDVIVCSGVLHHLDLNAAYPQLARVLKPDGRILCIEALGHNPIINLYRRLTPRLRTAWEVDHILKERDIRRAKQVFGHVEGRYFHLFAIGAALLRGTPLFGPVLAVLDRVDHVALRIPGLRSMAWQVLFELGQPKLAAAHEALRRLHPAGKAPGRAA
jgi:ubiquinone/menaquinone biosynthesis C-methylase UbiE